MAELSQKERLQPSLLDRLTDDEPEKKQESSENRVISQAKLRASVLRDLVWLFNSTCLSTIENLDEYPHAAQSVINYGLPELAGHTASSVDLVVLARRLRQAIRDYEPRLISNSVKVRLAINENEMNHNAMAFIIEAQLWSQPLPLQLYLRTEIDLENGVADIVEVQG
jgi:type VI secretion system protein ImpF